MLTNYRTISTRSRRPAAVAVVSALAIALMASSAAWGLGGVDSHTTVPELKAECIADAKTVEVAALAYDADPPSNCKKSACEIGFETLSGAGSIKVGNSRSYAHGTQAQKLIKNDYITRWPSSPHYAISLSIKNYPKGVHAGEALVYVPATSKHPYIFDDENSKNGCNAI